MDEFTEVTRTSWGSRLKSSIGGLVFGIILFIASFFLLFYNEGRSVKTFKAIAEMEKNVVNATDEAVLPENAGKLIHVSGRAVTYDVLTDSLTNISKKGIKLMRNVQMYQWVEHSKSETKEKMGGGTETVTTYSYQKEWSAAAVSSSGFKKPDGHKNPGMKYTSSTMQAKNVKLGAFRLNGRLVSKIGGSESYALTSKHLVKFPLKLKQYARLNNGEVFIGSYSKADPENPRIGDYRISYSFVAPAKEVSVMAKQISETFEPYTAKNGRQFEILKNGIHSAEAIIDMERKSNAMITWILRVVGFLMMFIGLKLVVTPLRTLLAVIPALANVFGAITGIALFLIALALSLITIAIAWFAARPILSIIILAVAAAAAIGIKMSKKKTASAATPGV